MGLQVPTVQGSLQSGMRGDYKMTQHWAGCSSTSNLLLSLCEAPVSHKEVQMRRSASVCHSPPCHTNSHCESVSYLRKRGRGRKISKKTIGGELEVWETAVPHEKEEERVLRAEWSWSPNPPGTQNGAVFWDKVFKDIIKLTWGH